MFAEFYLQHFNQTRAAIQAGYSEHSARTQGYDLLRDPDVSDYIHARMRATVMNTDEVLYHLREIAIGLRDDMTDSRGSYDLEAIKKAGKTHLVKGIRNKSITTETSDIFETEVDAYDRLRALELIGKHLAMFTDKVTIDDWRSQAIEDIKSGRVTYDALVQSFDRSLATELFALAGVPIAPPLSE